MSSLLLYDYRDEFHLKLFRRWYVIDCLSKNSKFAKGVPLPKAAFVDFLLCNPPVLQRLLMHFGRAESRLNLNDLLYRDNIEFGTAQDTADFGKSCALLASGGLLSFEKFEGEILLMAIQKEVGFENSLAQRWWREIEALQPLLGKSINVLMLAILGGEYGD